MVAPQNPSTESRINLDEFDIVFRIDNQLNCYYTRTRTKLFDKQSAL